MQLMKCHKAPQYLVAQISAWRGHLHQTTHQNEVWASMASGLPVLSQEQIAITSSLYQQDKDTAVLTHKSKTEHLDQRVYTATDD